MRLTNKRHDFGEVKQGEKLQCTFEFKNEGKSDLEIRKIKPNFSYVKATIDKTTIKANEKAIINVVFDTKGKRGKQSCNIKLITNDPKKSSNLLYVKAKVNG